MLDAGQIFHHDRGATGADGELLWRSATKAVLRTTEPMSRFGFVPERSGCSFKDPDYCIVAHLVSPPQHVISIDQYTH